MINGFQAAVYFRKSGKGDTKQSFSLLLDLLCKHLQIWKLSMQRLDH